MKQHRGLLLALAAGLILLALVGLGWQNRQEVSARHKLDEILGPKTGNLFPDNSPALPDPSMPDMNLPEPPALGQLDAPNSFFGFNIPMPKSGVEVKETPQAYELRIPLADPENESSIKLNVDPHRIEVAGQTGSKSGGAQITSSFMQSFSTSSEVLPDKISRKTEKKGDNTELVITIPKKTPGQLTEPTPKPAKPNRIEEQPPTPSLDDSFDDREHTVI